MEEGGEGRSTAEREEMMIECLVALRLSALCLGKEGYRMKRVCVRALLSACLCVYVHALCVKAAPAVIHPKSPKTDAPPISRHPLTPPLHKSTGKQAQGDNGADLHGTTHTGGCPSTIGQALLHDGLLGFALALGCQRFVLLAQGLQREQQQQHRHW